MGDLTYLVYPVGFTEINRLAYEIRTFTDSTAGISPWIHRLNLGLAGIRTLYIYNV